MSTPVLILIIVGAFIVSGIVLLLFLAAQSLAYNIWRLVNWTAVRAVTRRASSRISVRTSVMVVAALWQGVVGAVIVYLCSLVITNYEFAASFANMCMLIVAMGLMFPATMLLRACEVARRRSVPFDEASSGPIVLFLRGFATEGAFRDDTRFFLGYVAESEEEELAAVLARAGLGTLVGLAKPGQPYQELGAVRLDIGSSDWQKAVANLVSRASVIIYRLGTSDALVWEIEEIVRSGKLARTLFLPPAAVDEDGVKTMYELFLSKLAFSQGVPRFPRGIDGGTRYIFFAPDGSSRRVSEPKKGHELPWTRFLVPFFKQLGVAAVPKYRGRRNLVGMVVSASFVCWFVLVRIVSMFAG